MNLSTKEKLVRLAMGEAEKSIKKGDSPFGAVLTDAEGRIICVARNTVNTNLDPTAHAEINVIRKAAKKLKTKDLSLYYLISNAQSCPMCFAAAVRSKISNFVYGYAEDKTLVPQINVFQMKRYCKNKVTISTGILKDLCRRQINQARKKLLINSYSRR